MQSVKGPINKLSTAHFYLVERLKLFCFSNRLHGQLNTISWEFGKILLQLSLNAPTFLNVCKEMR